MRSAYAAGRSEQQDVAPAVCECHRHADHSPTLAARLQEEWLADSLARPGPLSRLSFAVGCLWAATVIRWDGDLVTAAATPAARVSTAMAAHGRITDPVSSRAAQSLRRKLARCVT